MSSKSQSLSSSSSSCSTSSFTLKHTNSNQDNNDYEYDDDYINDINFKVNLSNNTKHQLGPINDLSNESYIVHSSAILSGLNVLRENRVLCDVNLIAEGK